MYVIDVLPLSRTASGMLSYRSATNLPVGTIVNIMMRKTPTQGIVIDSVPVTDAKEMLKSARFTLSKSTPSPAGALPKEIMQAAHATALYHATTPGAVLAAMFAEYIKLGVPLPSDSLERGNGYTTEVVEVPLTSRAQEYTARIDINSARNRATLLVVPTLAELEFWQKELAQYSPLILSGNISGARRTKALTDVLEHSGLVISTPSFSWVPITRLGSIIIERVSAGSYTLPQRPYLSTVHTLMNLAEARTIPCVLADFPLPLEFRPKPDVGLSYPLTTLISICDARRDKEDQSDEKPWRVLPEAVVKQITKALSRKSQVIVLATRKGYSPGVVCRDCGQAQTDGRGIPLSFSIADGKRVFVTSDGVSVIDAKRKCQRCDSWNLLPLGIGIERVEEEVRAAFPESTISILSPEQLATPVKAKKAITGAYESGSIIIGTEALLPWLYAMPSPAKQTLGVIASADSLLALPFWRSRERFVRLAHLFAGRTTELVLITRHPEDSAVEAVRRPTSKSFWGEETSLRRALKYPPFGTLITLTLEGASASLQAEVERICTEMKEYSPSALPQRPAGRAKLSQTIAVVLPKEVWPDTALQEYLSMLPPSVRIRIDPESIW